MTNEIEGKKIAFVLSNEGVEQAEFTEPWKAVREASGIAEVIAPSRGKIQAYNHLEKGDQFDVDFTLDDVSPNDYDGLVLPGGAVNADQLRMNESAVKFAKTMIENRKPVAAICHAPWLLVEADVLKGRILTSWPTLKTDIQNAGGIWVDEEVYVDNGLVTSRKPDDLPAFCEKMIEEFREGVHSK